MKQFAFSGVMECPSDWDETRCIAYIREHLISTPTERRELSVEVLTDAADAADIEPGLPDGYRRIRSGTIIRGDLKWVPSPNQAAVDGHWVVPDKDYGKRVSGYRGIVRPIRLLGGV